MARTVDPQPRVGLSLIEQLGISAPTTKAVDTSEEKLRARMLGTEREPQLYAHCKAVPVEAAPKPLTTPDVVCISEDGSEHVIDLGAFNQTSYLSGVKRTRKRRHSAGSATRPYFPRAARVGRSLHPGSAASSSHGSRSSRLHRSVTPEPVPRAPRDTSPFSNVRIYDTFATPENVWQEVSIRARESLKASDQACGYIYVYTVEGNTDFVKIGYTSQSVTKRMEAWRRCNREPIPLFPRDNHVVEVPYARRVEALVHAELGPYRRAFPCTCGTEHGEWFKVSAEQAITTVRKWSEWAETRPYEARQWLEGKVWCIRKPWSIKFADPEGYLNLFDLTVV